MKARRKSLSEYQFVLDFFSSRELNILRSNQINLWYKVIKCTRSKLFSQGKYINARLSRKLIRLEKLGKIIFLEHNFFQEETKYWEGFVTYTVYPIGYNDQSYLTRENWDLMYPKLCLE